MRWFNKINELPEFTSVFGTLKLLTNSLQPPEKFETPKIESSSPEGTDKKKKKKKKKEE